MRMRQHEDCRALIELARGLPGPHTRDPWVTVRRYLIAEYDIDPKTIMEMSISDMRLYVEARQQKAQGLQAASVIGSANDGGNAEGVGHLTVRRPAKDEARNSWLYDRAGEPDPPSWKEMMAKLNRIASERGWRKLSSPQAVEQAVKRHIKRHGFESLPRRKET